MLHRYDHLLSTLQEIFTTSPFTWNYIETNTSQPTQTEIYHTSQKQQRDYHSTTNITKINTHPSTHKELHRDDLPTAKTTKHLPTPHTSSLTRSYIETTSPLVTQHETPTHPHTYHLSLGAIQRPLHCKLNQRPSPHFTTHLELYQDSPLQLTKPVITPQHISPLSKSYTQIASPLPIKIEIPNLHKELHKKRALHCLHYQTLFPPPNLNDHNELERDNFFTA